LPFEPDNVVEVVVEQATDNVVVEKSNKELNEEFKLLFTKARTSGKSMADIKSIIKSSGTQMVTPTTESSVIAKAIELLSAQL